MRPLKKWERAPRPAFAARYKGRRIWKTPRPQTQDPPTAVGKGAGKRLKKPWVCPKPWRSLADDGNVQKRRRVRPSPVAGEARWEKDIEARMARSLDDGSEWENCSSPQLLDIVVAVHANVYRRR